MRDYTFDLINEETMEKNSSIVENFDINNYDEETREILSNIIIQSFIEDAIENYEDDEEVIEDEVVEEGANLEVMNLLKQGKKKYKENVKLLKKAVKLNKFDDAERYRAEAEKELKEIAKEMKKVDFTKGEIAISFILGFLKDLAWSWNGLAIMFSGGAICSFKEYISLLGKFKDISKEGAKAAFKATAKDAAKVAGKEGVSWAKDWIPMGVTFTVIYAILEGIVIVTKIQNARTEQDAQKAWAILNGQMETTINNYIAYIKSYKDWIKGREANYKNKLARMADKEKNKNK